MKLCIAGKNSIINNSSHDDETMTTSDICIIPNKSRINIEQKSLKNKLSYKGITITNLEDMCALEYIILSHWNLIP